MKMDVGKAVNLDIRVLNEISCTMSNMATIMKKRKKINLHSTH